MRNDLQHTLFATDVLLVAARDTLYALDPDTGTVEWERSIDATLHKLSDGAVVLDNHDQLMAVEVASGETRWTVDRPTERAE